MFVRRPAWGRMPLRKRIRPGIGKNHGLVGKGTGWSGKAPPRRGTLAGIQLMEMRSMH